MSRTKICSLTLLALSLGAATLRADDRDLLRFKVAKPYVFVLLDTSASMNLKMGPDDEAAVGHGDDPDSRLYGAKEALFSVLSNVDDVHFGFAAFNHDGLAATTPHWLYYLSSVPGSWPFQGSSQVDWPLPDPDGLTTDLLTIDTNADGIPDAGDGVPDDDIEGDVLVFGAPFTDAEGVPLAAGTCAAPIDLGDPVGREQINAFAKTGPVGNQETTVWFSISTGPTQGTYRLVFDRPGNQPDGSPNGPLGNNNVAMKFHLTGPVGDCASLPSEVVYNFTMRLDSGLNRFVMVDRGPDGGALSAPRSNGPGGGNNTEVTAGRWPWSDAQSSADCGASHPFSGKGWEGNYDSGVVPPDAPPDVVAVDRYCSDGSCVELKPVDETVLSALGRPLDTGDMLPFRWEDAGDNRDAILQRLAPNWPDEAPRFGVAYHLADTADALGVYPPRIAGRPPLVAVGETPLEAAINDFRCWYMGGKGRHADSKCGESAYFEQDGWSAAACSNDPEYGCRRPYLLIISDGANTCPGEDATADLSDMKSFSGVSAFGLNVGDPKECSSGGGLHSIVQATGGECFNVANKEELKDLLLALIGEIREQAQTFATAAVPSVQATADQAIYISTFTPLNGKPVWDGHLNAFLKPLPLNEEGGPDTLVPCGDGVVAGCHLWDAGEAILSQYRSSDPIGDALDQRRVVYPRASQDAVPASSRLFEPVECDGVDAGQLADCVDLLDAMAIPYDLADPDAMEIAEDRANIAISAALVPRTHTLTNIDGSAGETIEYLMGDIFHSDPVVVGGPRNYLYFTQDLHGDGDPCTLTGTDNAGYRCYFWRQHYRRNVIFVGSNDGMVHSFDAGRFRESGVDPATGRTLTNHYGNGTGHELLAVLPREVLPTVRQFSESSSHRFSSDGPPAVADVFMDPVHDGTPAPAERSWRTVLIAGQREGGGSYAALDITQPDRLKLSASGEAVPDDNGDSNYLPSCLTDYTASECGPVPWGSVLWEFDDSHGDSLLSGAAPDLDPPLPMDEDQNGVADLGATWSTPVIGRIRLCSAGGVKCDPTPASVGDDADLVDVNVAVFGGGLDEAAADKSLPESGDWVYMVDVETGKVIYKRQLCSPYGAGCDGAGSVASEVAAVDTDQDGYLDRIYVPTTGGFLFRIDLVAASTGQMPALAATSVSALQNGAPTAMTAMRVPRVDGLGAPVWEPWALFDANWNGDGAGGAAATSVARQLYYPPAVFYSARLGVYGLAFGSGNRENLWDRTQQNGRFYVFLDESDALDPADLPLTESELQPVMVTDENLADEILYTRPEGQRGWYLGLDPDERVITEGYTLTGLTTFSAFQPETALTDDGGAQIGEETCGEKSFETDVDNLCARAGFSRNFVVDTRNGNALLLDILGEATRFQAVSTFVTTSFTEAGQLKDPTSVAPDGTSDDLTELEQGVMEGLKDLQPASCRYANYRLDLKMVAADTRVERIAPIPICIQYKNWIQH